MPLQSGAKLGSFEILGPLGAGGMGEVYRARDTHLGREVAIKVLPAAFAADPERSARFGREARLLATINHPAIAAIYGAEQFGGVPCIIMELVPGETLSETLARGPLPKEEALGIARQLAEALEAAHEKGVVHRDLKPSNIKVTPEGNVKVLDLGLAKMIEQASPDPLSGAPTVTFDETRPGVVLGTVEFMSPEQARGKPVDKRTDIWAFGCIVYEMLTGRRAFTGVAAADVFAAILSSEPDWSALPGSTPPRLRELLAHCLRKDPRQRLRDIGDAAVEIDQIRDGRAGAAPRAPIAAAESRWPTVALVAVIVAAAAAGWLALRSPPGAPPEVPDQKQLAVLPFRDLTGDEKGVLMGVGLVETISARLSSLPGLQVVTPTAVVAASDQEGDVLRVARKVGATIVVLGTFQRQGEQVRITYRVVNVRDGIQIAAGKLDGTSSDLFGLQDMLADVVSKDLGLVGRRRSPATPAGLDAGQQARYLQAVGLLQRYDRRDSVERGLEILRALVSERPGSAPVQAAFGRANLAMFDFTNDRSFADRAVEAAETARSLDPALPEADVVAGETLLATGRSKEATAAFRRALQRNPEDFQALLGLGRASESSGDDAAAEASFRRAISLQPSSFAAYNQLGGFFSDRGRWAESAEMFRKASHLAPDSYRALSNLGGVSALRCDFPAALEAFERAISLRPASGVAASNLGVTQYWLGRYPEAVASLERAAQLSPSSYRVFGNLGDASRAVRGGESKAARAYERAISLAREQVLLNPQDAIAHSRLAGYLAKTRRQTEADAEIRRALDLDSKEPSILVDAAVVSAIGGRREEALRWLRSATERGYCRYILARQPEFAAIRDEPAFQAIVAAPTRAAAF